MKRKKSFSTDSVSRLNCVCDCECVCSRTEPMKTYFAFGFSVERKRFLSFGLESRILIISDSKFQLNEPINIRVNGRKQHSARFCIVQLKYFVD